MMTIWWWFDWCISSSGNYEDEKATNWLLHLSWRWQYDVLVASAVKMMMVDCCISGDDWGWQYDDTMCLLHLRWWWRGYNNDLIVALVMTMTIQQYDVLVASAVMMMRVQWWLDCCISGDDTMIQCACCICGVTMVQRRFGCWISGGEDNITTAIWLLHLRWRWQRYDDDLIVASVAVATTKVKRRQIDCYICVDDDNTMCLLHLQWRRWWYDDDLIVESVVVMSWAGGWGPEWKNTTKWIGRRCAIHVQVKIMSLVYAEKWFLGLLDEARCS